MLLLLCLAKQSHCVYRILRGRRCKQALSRVAFAEHMIQLFKNLYESHFRAILREKGKLSKGACEFVLDSLWDVLQSRIDDQEPCPIAECELEVQIVALRRI